MVIEFIGRFHPVLVHLPIGTLLIALLLQLFFFNKKYTVTEQVLKIVWVAGALSAIFSCITGYLLFISGEYEEKIASIHLWMGTGVAIIAVYACSLVFLRRYNILFKIVCILLLLLIIGTGHFGGSLTHGEDYLTLGSDNEKSFVIQPIPDIQQANVYTAIVEPILNAKCYSCHGDKKQKGKLRMDNKEYLLKGGEDGEIIIAGDADGSEMIKRLLLPVDHKEHMPPKQKSQLAEEHITFLRWWVETGASFDKKINELKQPQEIRPILAMFQSGEQPGNKNIETEVPVEPADPKAIADLKEAGVVILPVAQNSNYLSANFITAHQQGDEVFKLLLSVKKQLVSLNLNYSGIGSGMMDIVGQCENIKVLQLAHINITDKDLAALKGLKQLGSLNLTGNKITNEGLLQLKSLPKLKQLYLYRTAIDRSNFLQLKSAFPAAYLDTGGYIVPTYASDTTELIFK